jgi:hypothetical protein
MVKKTHEKMLTISGHKGNANQNHIKILPLLLYNGYHQEQKQQMSVSMWGKRNISYTAGGNVN